MYFFCLTNLHIIILTTFRNFHLLFIFIKLHSSHHNELLFKVFCWASIVKLFLILVNYRFFRDVVLNAASKVERSARIDFPATFGAPWFPEDRRQKAASSTAATSTQWKLRTQRHKCRPPPTSTKYFPCQFQQQQPKISPTTPPQHRVPLYSFILLTKRFHAQFHSAASVQPRRRHVIESANESSCISYIFHTTAIFISVFLSMLWTHRL